MVLRMKNCAGLLKNPGSFFLWEGGGEGSRKANIEVGDCLKGMAWTVYRFEGCAWQERGG